MNVAQSYSQLHVRSFLYAVLKALHHTCISTKLVVRVSQHIVVLTGVWCVQGGYTALHFGVENNHGSLVELLLGHNAGVNIKAKVARGLRDNACVDLV